MRKTETTARGRERRRGTGRALFAIVAALGVHGAAVLLLHLLGPSLWSGAPPMLASAATNDRGDDRPIELTSLVQDIDRPDAPTREEKAREERKAKEENDTRPSGQVVDIAKPPLEERPDEARFTAEYDSKVDREKRGPTGRGKAGAAQPASATPPPAAAAPATDAGRGGRPGAEQPAVMARATTGHEGMPVDEDGQMLKRTGEGHGEPHPRAAPTSSAPGEAGDSGDGRQAERPSPASAPHPDLSASREMLERAIGAGPGSMDYLKDVEDGDATALNAKKWKFAPFFNRIKRAVAQEWHPDLVYVRHDPSGNVYGVKDRVTVLRIHLRPDGTLVGSNVIQSSGVDFLDDEAAEAFRKAQPYANPPKELVEADGQIHFTFAFIFELSGRTSFKVYKYK